MKILNLIFLLFPLIALSQKKFDIIREELKQNNKYEYVYGFENNYAVFRTFDKRMGMIDSTGSVIIKPVFTYIHNKKELKNLFEVGNEENKKFKRGFIDLKGNIKIPILYDDVFYVEKELIRVSKDKKFGVLDTLNNIILPTKFDDISFDNDLIIARIKETNYLYDFKGKQIGNLQFLEISDFTNNKAIVTFQNNSTSIIDNQGNVVLKPILNYSFERILNDDLFIIKDKRNLKEGVINSKAEFIIKCKYDEIKQVKSFFIAKSNNKKGFVSLTDSLVKPFVYDEIYFNYFDDAVAFGDNNLRDNYIVKKDNLFGVVNPNLEKEIIPIRYKNIRTLFDSYYIVQNDENKNGLFFKNGEKVLEEDYKFYNVFENSIFASKKNQQFLINLEAQRFKEIEVFVDEFVKFKDEQEFPKNGNQIFKSKGKFGVINNKNNMIIPDEYELIENIYLSKQFIVKKNNKFGIVNSENKIIVEIEYDDFKKLKESVLFTKDKQTIKKHHEITYQ
ncbi:KWG Leptospira [compost metagenome]